MIGLFDIIAIIINKDSKQINKDFRRTIIEQPGNLTWVCFLPWRTDLKTAKKYNFLPTNGKLIIYEVPDDLLGATPYLTLSAIKKMKLDFEKIFKKDGLANKNLAFLGLSAGTMPAFYLANRYTCKKLVAVCPTTKLGEGIFSSFAAKKIKKTAMENGFSAESYDLIINDINVENNLVNLPNDIELYLARFDKFVPFSGGNKLASKIESIKTNVAIKRFNFFGHILALYFFGNKNRKTNLPLLRSISHL